MTRSDIKIRHRMVTKLIVTTGFVLLVAMLIWAYFNIDYQKNKQMENIVAGTDRLTNTIRLGTQYAMMLNSRDDITQIITNIGKQEEIENIRIYNKSGEIKFSNSPIEVDNLTNIEAEASAEFKADGGSGAELTSGASTTVKGSLVKIN